MNAMRLLFKTFMLGVHIGRGASRMTILALRSQIWLLKALVSIRRIFA